MLGRLKKTMRHCTSLSFKFLFFAASFLLSLFDIMRCIHTKPLEIPGPSHIFMQQSASPLSFIVYQWWHCWNSSPEKQPKAKTHQREWRFWSAMSLCFHLLYPELRLQLIFFPLGYRNINFQPAVLANFLHLTAHSVRHRDCFRQGSGSVSQNKALRLLYFWRSLT